MTKTGAEMPEPDDPNDPGFIPEPPEWMVKEWEENTDQDAERLDFLDSIQVDDVWFPDLDVVAQSTRRKTSDKDEVDDVGVTSEAKGHEREVLRRAKLENDEYDSANKHRKIFLWFAVVVTSIPIAASSFGFVWMVITRQMENSSGIAIAYFSSVVVEVIGLMLVLANYLFPKGGGTPGLTNGDAPKPK